MNATDGELILLSGPPHNTKAVISVEPGIDSVAVRLSLAGQPAIYRAWVRPFGQGASQLRLKLPRETPPGSYRGDVVLGKETHAVVVLVSPAMRTHVEPRQTALEAAAGAGADFDIIVSNNGNIPIDVPKGSTLDLDDGEAQDRALGVALRADLGREEKRVDRFFEELRRSHGGEATVTVMEGAGALEPGASRALRCRIEVGAKTEPGRTYLGAWQVGSTSHVVAVTVIRAGTGEGERKPR